MSSFLRKILALKKQEVAEGMEAIPLKILEKQIASQAAAPNRFQKVMEGGSDCKIIAEIKYASPSRGRLTADYDLKSRVSEYERGGATAISVLTERYYFDGSYQKLAQVKEQSKLPVLQKDFIIHPWQIYRGRAAGASAVLLIAALLDDRKLQALYYEAQQLGMDCLVEVHDERELDKVMKFSPPLVGVNNRNLSSFTVDLDTCIRLAKRLPEETVTIAESGVKNFADIKRIAAAGYDGVLVGEVLMTCSRPAAIIKGFKDTFDRYRNGKRSVPGGETCDPSVG